eukprot:TRINITY_DN3363_c0_g1_i5.p1 TRINITY_DN3363_c0_g1~~TRINITY_DN3363_c0_g1_i5.p1  ORF type:complete len:272 (-),score=58.89 TRINITY_DN3363_c0_g1_i5:511-1326(-)
MMSTAAAVTIGLMAMNLGVHAETQIFLAKSEPDAPAESQAEERPLAEGIAGPSAETVNCTAYPMFCDKKVNCAANPLTAHDRAVLDKRLATADGHANLRAWCLAYPMYATSVQKCIVEGKPEAYAESMYESQEKLHLTNADAIYCFAAGHCNDTEISAASTAKEVEETCNKSYGHGNWTTIGWTNFTDVMVKALQMRNNIMDLPEEWKAKVTGGWPSKVRLAQEVSRISAMTACAMGNFKCDVAYCKAEYCNSPHYQSMFGNMSWVVPDRS